eukprot:gb/GECH01010553.1/.p1 GENE.gb/GECH01010553.1/~~gb/GECH01010553.1/.p1  ORF type:complete len:198 (+),score=51.95 gb/GECH01010553.1/:1-594(+)
MEVEIKLRIDKEGYQTLLQSLGTPEAIHQQKNIYFDGSDKEITASKSMLRLRFLPDDNNRCIATIKRKGRIESGVSRTAEDEQPCHSEEAQHAVEHPDRLLSIPGRVFDILRSEFNPRSMQCIGSLSNVRRVYPWRGHHIELDETQFPFGVEYGVELETEEPDRMGRELRAMLAEQGIWHEDARHSKFVMLLRGGAD